MDYYSIVNCSLLHLVNLAAWRRFQAVEWLESLVGPLGTPNQPSEKEFISCLRNGLILCNAINKIQPGAVPRVLKFLSHIIVFLIEETKKESESDIISFYVFMDRCYILICFSLLSF